MSDTVRLVATARLFVDGRRLLPGDAFVASEREAADLCALGFARRERKPALITTVADVAASAVRRRYNRRDLRAQP